MKTNYLDSNVVYTDVQYFRIDFDRCVTFQVLSNNRPFKTSFVTEQKNSISF